MEGHHLHHHQHQQQHQYGIPQIQGMESTTMGPVSDRFPQWSVQETRDFLMIRADLDQAFLETKRNKLLWEVVATKMKEKGYNRSSEQCKCKWKNLVTRYKGCETMEAEGMRQQFQFYNELQAIFSARMHRMLWMEAEAGGSGAGGSKKKAVVTLSSSSEDEDQNDDSEGEKLLAGAGNVVAPSARKRRKTKVGGGSGSGGAGGSGSAAEGLKEVLEEFMKQQMQIEMEWMKAYEAREGERQKREMEWRAKMEALEKERMMMERMWREREEQRRIREEARSERRDALITALLEKLHREGNL